MRFEYVKNLLPLILFVALSACGRAPVLELGQFSSYVERFEEVSSTVGAPVKVTDLVVKFGTVGERQDGVCETGDFIPPTIIINSKNWGKMSEDEREALMFHELGHCVLTRNHVTEMMDEETPLSMMYPIALNPSRYVEHREHYHRELFGMESPTPTPSPTASPVARGSVTRQALHSDCFRHLE
jgi:hypothetical protein